MRELNNHEIRAINGGNLVVAFMTGNMMEEAGYSKIASIAGACAVGFIATLYPALLGVEVTRRMIADCIVGSLLGVFVSMKTHTVQETK